MTTDEMLQILGWSKSKFGEEFKVNRVTVSRWGDSWPPRAIEFLKSKLESPNHDQAMETRTPTPAKAVKHKDKVLWLGAYYGEGSKYDGQYSASKINHYRTILKNRSVDQAVQEYAEVNRRDYVSGLIPGFDCKDEQESRKQFREILEDVKKDKILPRIPK